MTSDPEAQAEPRLVFPVAQTSSLGSNSLSIPLRKLTLSHGMTRSLQALFGGEVL